MLVIFDCCEHVIEVAAALAERLVKESPGVFVLATSREPLRVEGEQVHRLFPLDLPPAKAGMSATEASAFPVVQLFVERAAANSDRFVLDDSLAPTVVEICRRLDGIPLAIELAAARSDVFGVLKISEGLNDLFALLTDGRRTALPRHQTLRATLDWSYQLLSRTEQVVMQRLSVFRGYFLLESAISLAAFGEISAIEARQAVANLVSKSLLTSDSGREPMRYRFLDTTRAYAAAELAKGSEKGSEKGGESREVLRRHAELCTAAFENAEADWELLSQDKWLEKYAVMIDDVRGAQEWAFHRGGDVATGVAITAMSAPLWFSLLLMEEYCVRAELARKYIAQSGLEDSELEMKLNLALGVAIFHARGLDPAMVAAPARALQIAERLGATTFQLRALWQLARERSTMGYYQSALAYCERFDAIARGSPDTRMWVVSDRMMALGLFFVGRLREARVVAQRAVDHPAAFVRSAHMSFNEYDHRVASRSHLARILWVSGFADRAAKLAAEGVEHAMRLGYAPTACYILAFAAIPVALWSGDGPTAHHYMELLGKQSADLPSGYWHSWLRIFERIVALKDIDSPPAFGDVVNGILKDAKGPLLFDTVATFREELINPVALQRALSGELGWSAPEVIRADGIGMLRHGRKQQAEARFIQSIALARQHGSLSWELRAALSLAQLRTEEGRGIEASALLKDVCDRFPEGQGTVDLRMAGQFLDELHDTRSTAN
jgi:predicted ATPase